MMDDEIRAMHAITRRLKALPPESLVVVATTIVACADAEADLDAMQEATKITAYAARIEDPRVRERVSTWLYNKCDDLAVAGRLAGQVEGIEKGNGAA